MHMIKQYIYAISLLLIINNTEYFIDYMFMWLYIIIENIYKCDSYEPTRVCSSGVCSVCGFIFALKACFGIVLAKFILIVFLENSKPLSARMKLMVPAEWFN